jgi:hypothetical protein
MGDTVTCEHCGGMHEVGSDMHAEHMARTGMQRKFGRSSWGGGSVDERDDDMLDAPTSHDRGYAMKPHRGTIKKALLFVSKSPIEAHGVKGMKSTPWRKTFKTPEHLDKWVDANQAEVHATREIEKGIVKPDLKPSLKPEAKEALKDWYRGVYKVTKAFRYTCGNCGHSDAVHTIGGHPQPKSWGCARCKADTTDIKPITEAPVARGKFNVEPVFSETEKKKVSETGGYFKMLKAFVYDSNKDA